MTTKVLTILRGLPGSGKSHRAKRLVLDHMLKNVQAVAISTDEYFMAGKLYLFDPKELASAHYWNKKRCEKLMAKGIPEIIVDNTHTMLWEMRDVVELARKFSYDIEILTDKFGFSKDVQSCVLNNSHGVPLEAVQRMSDRWESTPPDFVAAILAAKAPWEKSAA